MSVKTRIEFTRAVAQEFFASIIALVLAIALSYILIIPLLIDGSFYEGKFIINEGFETFLLLVLLELSFLSVYLWRRIEHKENIIDWRTDEKKFSIISLVLLGIISGVFIWLFSYAHDLALIKIYGKESLADYLGLGYQAFPLYEKILIFIAGITIVPICEELFFRKMIFGNILRKGFTKTAYIFSAIMFVFSHFEFVGIFLYLAIGLFFAFLYHKTRTIRTSIFAHITFNAFTLSFLLF